MSKILIVDDAAFMRMMIKENLKRLDTLILWKRGWRGSLGKVHRNQSGISTYGYNYANKGRAPVTALH